MTNSKLTKRSLLASSISLLLCFAMLLGTTFAWFTDSATSAGNKIVAGNLDVQLLMDIDKDGEYETEISEISEPIFGGEDSIIAQDNNANTLWEPGKTQVAYLAIKNNGNLDLKYTVDLEVENVKNDLYEVMEYDIIEDAKSGDVSEWISGNGVVEGIQPVSDEAVKLSVGATHYFALAIHMKEEAGNEYQGGEVNFDLTVLATQLNAELDSFGADYDKDATLDFYPVGSEDALRVALANKEKNIVLTKNIETTATYTVDYNATINGDGFEISRADGFDGGIFSVVSGNTLTLAHVVIDGGAVWTNRSANVASGNNDGLKATGALITTLGNAKLILNEDTILQNNDGANAIYLDTRGGGSLTLNGAKIFNNRSAAGAIWGGGDIIINEGTVISGNHATSIGGAFRMVDGNNGITFTMNGGQIINNSSAGNGGAIWGGNDATYYFNGGEIAYNSAAIAGGAIWTGTYEKYYISGDFKMHDNSSAELGGAIRFCDHSSLTMTGGKVYNNTVNGVDNAFYLNNNSASIIGGQIADNFSYSGGLGLTVGKADIDGVITYGLSTNHNTAYLATEFNAFEFKVNESANFSLFNFKPADGYVYTEGDEAKLICKNAGYETYWDAATSTFCLRAK